MSARDTMIALRLTGAERYDFQRCAEAAGLTLSEWVRLVCRHASGKCALKRQLDRVDAKKSPAAPPK